MRSLYRQWVIANGVAELLGLGTTALAASQFISDGSSAPESPQRVLATAVVAILFGALCEGMLVGAFQGAVLRVRLGVAFVRRWIVATAAGAGLAWTLGMLPSTIITLASPTAAESTGPPTELFEGPLQHALAALLGVALGCVLGTAQWFMLRHVVQRARRWVGANALAWAAGMPLLFLAAGSPAAAAGGVRAVLVIGAACLGTGIVVGAIHGRMLVRLLPD